MGRRRAVKRLRVLALRHETYETKLLPALVLSCRNDPSRFLSGPCRRWFRLAWSTEFPNPMVPLTLQPADHLDPEHVKDRLTVRQVAVIKRGELSISEIDMGQPVRCESDDRRISAHRSVRVLDEWRGDSEVRPDNAPALYRRADAAQPGRPPTGRFDDAAHRGCVFDRCGRLGLIASYGQVHYPVLENVGLVNSTSRRPNSSSVHRSDRGGSKCHGAGHALYRSSRISKT